MEWGKEMILFQQAFLEEICEEVLQFRLEENGPKIRTNWQKFGLFFIAVVQPFDLRHFGAWEKVIQLDFQIVFFLGTFEPLKLHFLTAVGGNPMTALPMKRYPIF